MMSSAIFWPFLQAVPGAHHVPCRADVLLETIVIYQHINSSEVLMRFFDVGLAHQKQPLCFST